MAGNQTVLRVKKGVVDRIAYDPHYYRFWWYGMDPNDVGRMAAPWQGNWDNCTSFYNGILGEMGDEGYPVGPVGGTGDWNGVVGTNSTKAYEQPVTAKNYPPGSFGVTPYTSDQAQGHLQMVYEAAAPAGELSWGDQRMAQSDFHNGSSSDGNWGYPGSHLDYTMGQSFQYVDYPTWIGLIPGVPVLDGFPGYSASALEIVRWYMDLCKWWYDMPPAIPLVCVAAELSTVLDKDRDYSIWDIPGYATAVDHTSYGQHQQLWDYYPWPWDFETAAWAFMCDVDRAVGSGSYPTSGAEIGELVANIQRPAAEYRYRYAENYDWVAGLIEEAGGVSPPDPPKPGPPKPPPPGDDDDVTTLDKAWVGFTADPEQWMRAGDKREDWHGVPFGSWGKFIKKENGNYELEFIEPKVDKNGSDDPDDPDNPKDPPKPEFKGDVIDFSGEGEILSLRGKMEIRAKEEPE